MSSSHPPTFYPPNLSEAVHEIDLNQFFADDTAFISNSFLSDPTSLSLDGSASPHSPSCDSNSVTSGHSPEGSTSGDRDNDTSALFAPPSCNYPAFELTQALFPVVKLEPQAEKQLPSLSPSPSLSLSLSSTPLPSSNQSTSTASNGKKKNRTSKKRKSLSPSSPSPTPSPTSSSSSTMSFYPNPSPPSSVSSSSDSHPIDPTTIRELLKEQDVKKQRLARKAELARMSRRRKKVRLDELEDEVARLEKLLSAERDEKAELKYENERLKEKLNSVKTPTSNTSYFSNVDASTSEVDSEMSSVLSSIRTALHDPLSQEETHKRNVDRLVSLMKKKSEVTVSHLTTLQPHLMPSLPLQFLEWAMNQNEKFYQDQNGLWATLMHREIGLSPEQIESVMELRRNMKVQRASAESVDTAYRAFSDALSLHLNQASSNMEELVRVFTPEQLAKFFMWVNTYGSVCVKINL